MDIRRNDLNLLAVFEVLMQERNVTRAAQRLGLSQPAVSAALGRLRRDLGDPLLVRSSRGMRPTARAEQLVRTVSQAFDSIQSTVAGDAIFVPARASRSFTLMLSDIGEIIYLPRLIQRVQKEAPGIQISVRRLARPLMAHELSVGSVDLALGWVERVPAEVCQLPLFNVTFVCILRPDHPRIGSKLSLAQFISEWHLVVGRHDPGPDTFFRSLDGNLVSALTRKGLERKVAMRVPHFLAVPNIIAGTDLLCVVPRMLAEVYAAQGQVRFLPLPLEVESFSVSQFWHKRFDSDRGNAWLREVIREQFDRRRGRR